MFRIGKALLCTGLAVGLTFPALAQVRPTQGGRPNAAPASSNGPRSGRRPALFGGLGQRCITFEDLPAGTIPSRVFAQGSGPISIQGFNPAFGNTVNAAVIFDSANPTGEDPDLGTPNEDFAGPGIGDGGAAGSPFQNDRELGKVLIIGEDLNDANNDGLVDDPDDADGMGEQILFDFSAIAPVIVYSIDFLDGEADRPNAFLEFFDASNQSLGFVAFQQPGNNGLVNIDLGGITGVHSAVFTLNGSGAIDNFCFERFFDCNDNGINDDVDIEDGTSQDCNGNLIPDECEDDCDGNGVPDTCEEDCDSDGIPDACEPDCDDNGVPDDCEPDDCNGNGIPDACDPDCDDDGIPDDCEADCDSDGTPDDCEPDCDNDGVPDDCEDDCDSDGTPDACEPDCDGNGIPDDCEDDCDDDGTPDACEPDCDGNGVPDDCDGDDCDNDGIPDSCEPDCDGDGTPDDCSGDPDCDSNGIPDSCDPDCDNDGLPDSCDGPDCDGDGTPDECEPDCDHDGLPDDCDGPDCNGDGIPDECEPDCNGDGIPDACENDCDNDGIPDACDGPDCDGDGIPDECEPDCDSDGIPDDCEPDCDNDGLPDDCEPDCDGDGTPDDCEPDCDNDNIPDDCEPDCDNDGIPDDCEGEPDCNMNGIPDSCEPDCDGDGLPDDCEVDDDDNGIPDDCEECSVCAGRVNALTLLYSGSSTVTIRVDQKNGDTTVFNGVVNPGDTFDFVSSGSDFGTEVKIYVDGVLDVKLHTSCSKPIGRGTVAGNYEVITGTSTEGGTLCPLDCGECDGRVTRLTLKYLGGAPAVVDVFQAGDVAFSGMVAPGGEFTFSGLDENGSFGTSISILVDGNLDTDVHTSCSVTIAIGSVFGSFEVTEGWSRSGGPFCDIGEQGNDVCGTGGKPQVLFFTYTGEDCSASSTTQDSSKWDCTGDPAMDASVHIVASSADGSDVFANVTINLGDPFAVDATMAGLTKLPNETHIYIYDELGGTLLQEVYFHCSCSQDLFVGNQWGAAHLDDFILQ